MEKKRQIESHEEEIIQGFRHHDHKQVHIHRDSKAECLAIVRLEIEKNYEWALEIRKRVGLQSIIWPFAVIGAAVTSQIVNPKGVSAVLDNQIGLIATITLVISFNLLGVFSGLMEKRLWERMQYLRRLVMTIIADNNFLKQGNNLTLGCFAERDYKKFGTRGAYLIQYVLVTFMSGSALILIVILVSPVKG